MTATYFNKSGAGHSRRGLIAREQGALAWSRLPANLRRKLSSGQAESLRISFEWHHTGKYANKVFVYYPEQVEAYWATLEAEGVSPEQALVAVGTPLSVDSTTQERKDWLRARIAVAAASDAAERVREELE